MPTEILSTPTTLLLEASSVCQLACPSCPTAEGKIDEAVGRGFLKFDYFKQLVDNNPNISCIELSNWGEIFLNPDLPQIMKYAYKRGVKLKAENGVNLNTVKKEALEAAVKYRFRYLNCSIDGATQEVYEIYRKRGKLSNVLDNIRSINALKKSYNSPFPELQWQFIMHGHNEHEILAAKKMAEELNMRFFLKLQWGDMYGESFSPVRDREFIRSVQANQVADRQEFADKFNRDYIQPCVQLWQTPQINFDGKLLGCCINHWSDFGVVGGANIHDAINSEKMSYAREMLMGKVEAKDDIPCSSCSIYKQKLASGSWMTTDDAYKHLSIPPKLFGSARTYNIMVNKLLTAKNRDFLGRIRSKFNRSVH